MIYFFHQNANIIIILDKENNIIVFTLLFTSKLYKNICYFKSDSDYVDLYVFNEN